MVAITFSAADCMACPTRALCTRDKTGARNLTLQSRPEHEAIRARPASASKGPIRCPVRAPRPHQGHTLAGDPGIRLAKSPLPWPGQDPPTARRHRDRHLPRPSRRLVESGAPRHHQMLSLRCPRACRLTRRDQARAFRRRYPPGTRSPQMPPDEQQCEPLHESGDFPCSMSSNDKTPCRSKGFDARGVQFGSRRDHSGV
jgi:hypothetical protein